tara:strand:- start:3580 stop:3837 length:258 start_codon:yes stop_codon:yes gene_type:complete
VPIDTGYIPVIKDDLEGLHTPTVVKASVKIKLSDASSSKFGVEAVESPYIDKVGLISSTVIQSIFGFWEKEKEGINRKHIKNKSL